MKAVVTSMGEPTTDLCVWSLKRNGFDVHIIEGKTTLAEKLKEIYQTFDETFVRVDADVIVNRNLNDRHIYNIEPGIWWRQFHTFDWFKQDINTCGIQLIRKPALPYLRNRIDEFLHMERPETELSRIPEFDNPRRFQTYYQPIIMGIHGVFQNDIERVKATKKRRNQVFYDWDLVRKLEEMAHAY